MTSTTRRPEVSDPGAGPPANAMPEELAERFGYVEEERFLSGEATAYEPVGELTSDGTWTIEPGPSAAYRTRVVVRRPADPDHFNGTAVIEWFNVTAGVDADPDFGLLHELLLGHGFAYVGVSAQQVAVGGGETLIDIPDVPDGARLPLTQRDPDRYGSLVHPGDAWSYAIYAQAAEAVRHGDLLDGARPERVLAIGESQSAFRLVSFINAVQPLTGAYDGFLVHSRGAGCAPVSGEQLVDPRSRPPVTIRTDLDVPVLQFETETDLMLLKYLAARQPDTDRIVTWEVAGTAHADATILEYGRMANKHVDFDIREFVPDLNTGPQAQVLRAALAALVEWVASGTVPPSAAPIETTGDRLRRDEDGIVVGGVRTPSVDAPVATLSGESADEDNILAQMFGTTTPFTAERLQARYPTHDRYVAAVTASADEAVAARFLLPADRDAFIAEAEGAAVPC